MRANAPSASASERMAYSSSSRLTGSAGPETPVGPACCRTCLSLREGARSSPATACPSRSLFPGGSRSLPVEQLEADCARHRSDDVEVVGCHEYGGSR